MHYTDSPRAPTRAHGFLNPLICQRRDGRIVRLSVACGGSLPVGSGRNWMRDLSQDTGFFCGFACKCLAAFFRGWVQVRKTSGPLDEMGWVMIFSRAREGLPGILNEMGLYEAGAFERLRLHAVWARRRQKNRFGQVPQY